MTSRSEFTQFGQAFTYVMWESRKCCQEGRVLPTSFSHHLMETAGHTDKPGEEAIRHPGGPIASQFDPY